MVQKKRPILLFMPKSCFTIFFHIFRVVYATGLGDPFDTSMDPTGLTTLQRIKIIEAYFATKPVLLRSSPQQIFQKFKNSAEIPALLLCQKNWFCGKVRLDCFYPLLRSIASSWIHIGVERISQACCVHHLKNIEKKNKTQFQSSNFKTESFFWTTLHIRFLDMSTS